jgi:hypothetical protein
MIIGSKIKTHFREQFSDFLHKKLNVPEYFTNSR